MSLEQKGGSTRGAKRDQSPTPGATPEVTKQGLGTAEAQSFGSVITSEVLGAREQPCHGADQGIAGGQQHDVEHDLRSIPSSVLFHATKQTEARERWFAGMEGGREREMRKASARYLELHSAMECIDVVCEVPGYPGTGT